MNYFSTNMQQQMVYLLQSKRYIPQEGLNLADMRRLTRGDRSVMNHHGLLYGFRDRMENIGVFLPLFNLLQKNRYKELPLFDLGMSVLLYVLENMLKNQGTTNEELVGAPQYVSRDKLGQSLSTKEADQLRGVLVDEFLRNNGEPFVFSYVDMESNQQREYAFHLLEYDDYTVQELQRE